MSKLPKQLDASLKSIWVDQMNISVRAEAPITTLSFFTLIEGKILAEACRVNMTTMHLQGIADVICRVLDYYPTKATAAAKKKR